MAEIELTRGKVAIVDEDDFDWLSERKWTAMLHFRGKRWWAARSVLVSPGKYRHLAMSREIMGLAYGDIRQVDHFNFDTLDNRRSNLRIVSGIENRRHQPSRGGTSHYVGVSWSAARQKWCAQVHMDGRAINLGRYNSGIEAAAARDSFVLANQTGHSLNLASAA